MSVRILPEGARPDGGEDPDEEVRSLFTSAEDATTSPPPRGAGIARPTRTTRWMPRLPRWSVRLPPRPRNAPQILLIGLAVVATVIAGAAWRLSTSQPGRPTGAAASSSAQGADPAARPAGDPTRAEQPAATAVSWQGAVLPISPVDGPSRFSRTRSSGFTDTPHGAALAAVHIATHIDALTGPDVFTPAIKGQVLGGKEELLRQTRRIYRRAAENVGVTDGGPILVPTGDVRSWRIQRFEPGGGNDVELLVKAPDGERMVYEVPLQWRRGDWRLVAPQSSKRSVFGVSPALGAAGFTPFIEQPEQKP